MEDEVEEEEDLSRLRADEKSFDPKLKTSGHVHRNSGEVSLREWLDRPKRQVDFVECLHIFRQVVEAVNMAHTQGVVVNNIRPSCFVLSTLNRVSFIESASCSDTSCGEEEGSYIAGAATAAVAADDQLTSMESVEGKRELCAVSDADEWRDFPLKKILTMEFTWYASPEEVEGRQSTFASDVYKLGVLLFELFCMFETLEEKLGKMSNLRDRVLPPQMLLKWPKEASFCLWLLHPQPSNRPSMSELLQSDFLNEEIDSLEEREAAIRLKEGTEELELVLDFLLQLQTRKVEAADKLHDTICFLCADIEEVENQRSSLIKNGCSFLRLEKRDHRKAYKFECPLPYNEINEDSSSSGSRKRIRPGQEGFIEENNLHHGPRPHANKETRERMPSKSSRILKNFKRLEELYFSSRCRTMRPTGEHFSSKTPVSNPSSGSTVRTEGSSVDYFAFKEGIDRSKMGESVNPFLEGLCKFLYFSKFKVRAVVKQGDLLNASNLICSLAFDRDNEFFATAGVNRKIKVFECDAILNEDHNIHYPAVEMTSKSKLSNVCWNGYIKSQIASSDFEGVVQVWDVARSKVIVEMREHEKRVWSVNYSIVDPTKLASGSDDGTVKLWNINQGGSTGTIITKANVCSVQFPPDSASVLAIGSADHNVYYYDLRNVRLPLLTLAGHARTVSYVKFVDSSTLVSSSTDNSLKLWDLTVSSSGVIENPIQTFTGHTNVKNFVGLSISDGYIASGSETNEVFVYHKAFPMPVLSYRFGSIDPISGREADGSNQFISCLCWRGDSHSLVAANSIGNIEILEMV